MTSIVGGALSDKGVAVAGHLTIGHAAPHAPQRRATVRKAAKRRPATTHRTVATGGHTTTGHPTGHTTGHTGGATTPTTTTTGNTAGANGGSTATGTGAGATGSSTPPTSTAAQLSPFEARLLTLVNGARATAGLHALHAVAGATDVARRWSVQLAEAGALSHNPDLVDDLAAAGSSDWHIVEENVGAGPAGDADTLFAAYMASPHHRANILDPAVTVIGIGAIAVDDSLGGTVWNTLDFADAYDTSYGAPATQPVTGLVEPSALSTLLS